MKTSQAGKEFITEHEGVRLSAYQDQAGLWTIGVGHLIRSYEQHLTGAPITMAVALELLANDLVSAENDVKNAVSVELDQNQFDSLVSIAFNIGGSQFRSSTFKKRINAGDTRERITEAWRWWNKYTDANGNKVVSRGLDLRRTAETDLYYKSADQKKK
ncbi:MAG: lysozyme [Gammaproteobacteria bacterium]|nr:lysozyme [Gammaproteobacteria bacterium]